MSAPLMLEMKYTRKLWLNYIRRMTAEAGVPDSYRMILMFLLRNPGTSQKELAQYCNITTASISQTVKEMQLTGYLTKETDAKDQRFVKLFLTDKGEAAAGAIRRKFQEADRIITDKLTPERRDLFIQMLHELAEIIEKELPGC